MKNQKLFGILGTLISMICYFAVLFLLTGSLTAVSITGTAFTLLAFLLCCAGLFVYFRDPVIELYFYMLPSVYMGMLYLAVQCIAALVLSVLDVPLRAALITEAVITGILGGIQCYVIYAGMRARSLNTKMKEKISGMRALAGEAQAIMDLVSDVQWRHRCRKVVDELKYADPVTAGRSGLAEEQIRRELERLREAVLNRDEAVFQQCLTEIHICLTDRKVMK